MPGPADDGPVTRDDVLPAGARQCFACGDDNPIGSATALDETSVK